MLLHQKMKMKKKKLSQSPIWNSMYSNQSVESRTSDKEIGNRG